MRRSLAAALLSCALAACGGSSAPRTLTPAEIAQRSSGSIVRVESMRDDGAAQAAGFVVGSDGLVATNLHAIERALEITVVFPDKRRYAVREVLLAGDDRDLAVLRIDAGDLAPLRIGGGVRAGDHVTIGGGADCRVSAIRRAEKSPMLQLGAPIARGSSGAPVLDDHGDVVGVATQDTHAILASELGDLLGPRATPLSVAELRATAVLTAPAPEIARPKVEPEPPPAKPAEPPAKTCKACGKPAPRRKPKKTG